MKEDTKLFLIGMKESAFDEVITALEEMVRFLIKKDKERPDIALGVNVAKEMVIDMKLSLRDSKRRVNEVGYSLNEEIE